MKRLQQLLFITGLLLMIPSLTKASFPDKDPDTVLPVQEKVYLHFDNNCYFLGDTIWYKAYVVLADDNTPQPLSRILYVELLNEQGYLMERQQLVVDEVGHANGQFAICDTTFAGFYEIRAYTKWMLNFGYEASKGWYTQSWIAEGSEENNNLSYNQADANDVLVEMQNSENNTGLYRGTVWSFLDEKGEETKNLNEAKQILKHDNEYLSMSSIDTDGMRKVYRDYYNLFSRVIPVYNRPDSAEHYMRKVMPTKITMGDYEVRWKTPEFDVKFYPEGGALLEGKACRVAWEAMSQQLERLNVKGALYEDGELLDSLMPYHAGRGLFTFTPQPSRKYEVIFEFEENKFEFPLPDILKQGARLIVDQDEDGVYFNVAQTFNEEPPSMRLTVYSRGKKIQAVDIPKNENEWETAMYKEDLPEGVNQVVIADDMGNVYADRLFFINRIDEAKAKILVGGIPNRAYQPREHIKLNLLATDAKGTPLKEQNFSVAIRDADQLDPSFATGNILTNLLLESELRGFVENPDYYFEANDEKHQQALDLLLLVQGWRRYDWKTIERPDLFIVDYLPEQKMMIYGQAIPLRKGLFEKDQGLFQISCSLMNLNDDLKEGDYYLFKGAVEADTAGYFQLAYEPFYGKVKLALRAKFVKKMNKKKYDLVTHDDRIFVRKQYFFPTSVKEYSWYETNNPETIKDKKLTWEDFQDDIYASEWIPQVNIKSKKRPHSKRQHEKVVFSIDYLDFLNNRWDQGYYNIEYKLDNHEFDADATNSFFMNYIRGEYEPPYNIHETQKICYDWSVIPTDHRFHFISLLDRIDVVGDSPRRPTSFYLYHLDREASDGPSFGIDTYINIISLPEDEKRFLLGREYNLQGFTRPIEYYQPDYSKIKMPEMTKDYRRTLYWNPNVTTDKYGQVTIDFYNSSVCTTIDVSAEGVTRHGEFIITAE